MEDLTFNTTPGAVVERKLLILYGNIGTFAEPTWKRIGSRVEDSSDERDYSEEVKKDIFGITHTTMQTPTITQTFDPCELDAGDEYQMKLWNLAIKDQNVGALCNQDLLLVHAYAGDPKTGAFAERYPASAVKPSGLGGSSNVAMPIDVTYGGKRTIGTAKTVDDAVIFTPEAE